MRYYQTLLDSYNYYNFGIRKNPLGCKRTPPWWHCLVRGFIPNPSLLLCYLGASPLEGVAPTTINSWHEKNGLSSAWGISIGSISHHSELITPRRINMEPENTPLREENHLPNQHFQLTMLTSGGCMYILVIVQKISFAATQNLAGPFFQR